MGTKRDKRRKKKGHVPGQGLKKTESKTAKNEEKQKRRAERKLDEDDDIDAILAQIKREEAKKTEVKVEENCDPPSARVHASYTSVLSERNELVVVFGGEYEDLNNGKVQMYNDLFKYKCDKDRWTRISSPNSPPPRSSHQAVAYKSFIYMFGGEFTSPKQDRFHHYRDLWRFDLTTNEWEDVSMKSGPSARSGHRMAVHKNKIILFGGFLDTGRDEVKYFNDLWVLDLGEMTWKSVGEKGAYGPSPRGGSRMLVFENVLYLYGGYSRTKDDKEDDMEHGKVHDDLWALDLETYKWEKVSKAGMAPGPRSGFGLAVHKRRAVVFGGVTDNESKGGEAIVSDFHNDMYQFNFDKRRWFPVVIRPPKKSKAQKEAEQSAEEAEGAGTSSAQDAPTSIAPELDEKLHKAATRIQSRYRGYVVRKAYKLYRIGGVVTEVLYSPALYGIDLSAKDMLKPRGRINPGMVVVKNTMWLFGGIVEIQDKELALDDIWCFDLNKYDGWQCVRENSVGEEAFKSDASGTSSGDENDDDDDDSDSE